MRSVSVDVLSDVCSVSDALKQLSVVDSLSRSITSLRCSLDQIINNSNFSHVHVSDVNADRNLTLVCPSSRFSSRRLLSCGLDSVCQQLLFLQSLVSVLERVQTVV